MIPKIIHYCWLSNDEKTEVIKECMDSWKMLEDVGFSFMLWDRTKFDINSTLYTKSCWDNNLYAFICDYVRLKALYEYGGIYLDCDIKMLKPFDDAIMNQEYFLVKHPFCGINATVIGCEKNNDVIKFAKEYYENNILPYPFDVKNVMYMERRLATIYNEYKDLKFSDSEFASQLYNITDKTYCFHFDVASWFNDLQELRKNKNISVF